MGDDIAASRVRRGGRQQRGDLGKRSDPRRGLLGEVGVLRDSCWGNALSILTRE
jgi:hypothetical protein